jgi:hypothetical protein
MSTIQAAASPSPHGGPRTPAGKARSARNATKHGLRARDFALSPDEDPAEWALHLATCEQGYGPVDPHERNLVCAIAAAMWNEVRADRAMAEVMAHIPPIGPGVSHGPDAQEPAHALSLSTAVRYQTAAGTATQRAQRGFFAYRTAKLHGLIVPQPTPADPAPTEPANENRTNEPARGTDEPERCEPHARFCTNELSADTREPEDCTPEPGGHTHERADCTNEPTRRPPTPEPLLALHARLDRLLQQTAATSPGDRDLLAAIRGLKLPGAAAYLGPIDPAMLGRALAERGFELGGLAWLRGFAERTDAGATQGRGSGDDCGSTGLDCST